MELPGILKTSLGIFPNLSQCMGLGFGWVRSLLLWLCGGGLGNVQLLADLYSPRSATNQSRAAAPAAADSLEWLLVCWGDLLHAPLLEPWRWHTAAEPPEPPIAPPAAPLLSVLTLLAESISEK
nr:uncharacterized protein LOC118878409 [Drosophila suzukii]